MDWLERMNLVLDYVEEHLDDEVDYGKMAKMSLCSGNLFQRMFSTFTGLPLSEYIRRRKLSEAAMDLAEGKTVLETALKFGYDSGDAFAHAFKALHGIPPSKAKLPGTVLTLCPKLSFTLQMRGEMQMKYRLVEKDAWRAAGKTLRTTQEENMKQGSIPKFWDRANQDGTSNLLCALAPGKPLLGLCFGDDPDGSFRYMIGVETAKAAPDLETLEIPAATWAVFESVGPMPGAIQKVWNEVFRDFLPASRYEHAPIPDFESYPEDDPSRADYRAEVWIPVIPKR